MLEVDPEGIASIIHASSALRLRLHAGLLPTRSCPLTVFYFDPSPGAGPHGFNMDLPVRIGIINVSDRASAGIYEDVPGKAAVALLREYLRTTFEPVYRIIADERDEIAAALIRMADVEACCLVITTGGTGPAPRDVTPEATEDICDKMLPGFGELMRSTSLKYVPTAILSRQTAGVRGKTLIINLPGKPKAIRQCLEAVFPAIPFCIDLIEGPYLEHNPLAIEVFRPRKEQ
jgi:molybdopterin adenylyltransferase